MRQKNKESNITFPLYPARRRPMLAPPRRQNLHPPSGHANRPCTSPEGSPLPEGPQLPEGPPLPGGPLFPAGPLFPKGPAGGSPTPFKSKFVGSRGTKSEK